MRRAGAVPPPAIEMRAALARGGDQCSYVGTATLGRPLERRDVNPLATYFRRVWTGGDGPVRMFLVDMVFRGTLVNVAGSGLALAAFAADLPIAIGLVAHFAPVPYNVFLFLSVWRACGSVSPTAASVIKLLATAWIVLAMVL